jgi:hypothetical protein
MEQGEGKRSLGDIYEWAKTNQPELFDSIFGYKEPSQSDPKKSILDMYRDCNNTNGVKKDHQMYINMARIGNMNDYVGIDWLIWWYQRNLILYSNITRIANSSEDRILLIIGSAHVYLISQFLKESGLFGLESAERYLGN